MKKGLFATSALACVLIAGGAASASATMLETFEEKFNTESPDGEFSYESVISDTDDGFEITGVRIVDRPDDPVVTIDRLRVGAMDMEALLNEEPPTFMDVEAVNFHVPAEAMDNDSEELFPGGATFDFIIDYELDQTSGGLTVDQFSVGMEDYGVFSISFALSGVTGEAVAGFAEMGPMALGVATLHNLSITLDDDGALGQFFAFVAEEEGMEVGAFVEAQVLGGMQMGAAMFAADPIGSSVIAAVTDFLADYGDPAGPLVISANPDEPVAFASLMGAMMGAADPTTLPALLGLSATYDKEGGESGGLFGNN